MTPPDSRENSNPRYSRHYQDTSVYMYGTVTLFGTTFQRTSI